MPNYSDEQQVVPTSPERDWVEIPTVQARREVISFLQQLFSVSPNPALKWDPDPEVSGILIVDSIPDDLSIFGRRPVIVVATTGAQIMHLTIDDLEWINPRTGEKIYSTLMSTTMIISCVSSSEIESEHMAWLVAKYVWLLKDQLRRAGFHDIGRGIQISRTTPFGSMLKDSASVYRQTTVSFPVFFQQRHHVTPPCKPIKKFDVGFTARSTKTKQFRPGYSGIEGTAVTEQNQDLVRQRPPSGSEGSSGVVGDILNQEFTVKGEDDG